MVAYVSRRAEAVVSQGLDSGSIVALLGPRGSGKSATLGRALERIGTHERIEIELDRCPAGADVVRWARDQIDPSASTSGDFRAAIERRLTRSPVALVIDHLDSVDKDAALFESEVRRLSPLAGSRLKIVVTSRLSFTYVNAPIVTLTALHKDELAAMALACGAPMTDDEAPSLAEELAPTAALARELSDEVAAGSSSWRDIQGEAKSQHPGKERTAPKAIRSRREMVARHVYALPDALQAGLVPIARGEAIPEKSAPTVLIREGVLRQGAFGRAACPLDQRLLGSVLGITPR